MNWRACLAADRRRVARDQRRELLADRSRGQIPGRGHVLVDVVVRDRADDVAEERPHFLGVDGKLGSGLARVAQELPDGVVVFALTQTAQRRWSQVNAGAGAATGSDLAPDSAASGDSTGHGGSSGIRRIAGFVTPGTVDGAGARKESQGEPKESPARTTTNVTSHDASSLRGQR